MLSVTAEYAVGALCALARQPEGVPLQGRVMAQQMQAPANYLSKVLLTLKRAGFVGATRGVGGGYRLLRRPEEIKLVEVVKLFERPVVRENGFLSSRGCSEYGAPCTVHGRWQELRSAHQRFLRETTLADLASCGTIRREAQEPLLASQEAS